MFDFTIVTNFKKACQNFKVTLSMHDTFIIKTN